MGVRIEVGEGEPIGKALRRFKQLVERAGIRYQWGRHRFRLKPCEERRHKRGNKKIRACQAARRKRRELGLEPIPKK